MYCDVVGIESIRDEKVREGEHSDSDIKYGARGGQEEDVCIRITIGNLKKR